MIAHLNELRDRTLHVVYYLSTSFILLFFIKDSIYSQLAAPLLKYLPKGGSIIATDVTATFMVPVKLCFTCSLMLTMPYILYNIWKFVAPGLFQHERKFVYQIMAGSSLLFYLGVVFGFIVICPLALNFFANCAPQGVVVMTDIANYLDFVQTILLASGVAFQVPVITILCLKLEIVTKRQLQAARPYVIVISFILGMLLTPPDVVSQIMLAIPMCLLYELTLFFAVEKQGIYGVSN